MPVDLPDFTSSVVVANSFTLLHTFTKGAPAAKVWTLTVPAATVVLTYGALIVTVVVTTTPSKQPLCVQVHDPTVATSPRFCAPFGLIHLLATTVLTNAYQAVVPLASIAGHPLQLTVFLQGTNKGKVLVYGLTTNPGVGLRADGRAHPMGFNARGAAFTAATGTIVPTPASPLRVLLRSASLADSVAASVLSLTATVNAGTRTLLSAQNGAANVVWDAGLLCDPGTAVKFTSTAGAATRNVAVTYDLVV